MTTTLNLGFAHVPGSIRVRAAGRDLVVNEVDPQAGAIAVKRPSGLDGEVTIDYERQLFQGSEPRHTQILGDADACIYCGSRADLTDEHIIPFALEGDFVIRDGSCRDCAAKISRFERQILREALLAPRTALHLRTHRPLERPSHLPVLREVGEARTTVEVPVQDHPTYLALPVLDLPAHLRHDPIPNLRIIPPGARLVSVSPVTIGDSAGKLGAGRVGVEASFDIYAFARFLAKIAHGFVAVADLGAVEAFLPGPMFEHGESIGMWVGGAPEARVGTNGLHGVHLEMVEGEVHVRVRLFAQLGGPEYLVVAGRLIDPTPNRRPSVTIESRARRPAS